ncbi:BTAD domain-containing putative transcriptional regulator [Amycolatopsis sp. NPDC024027]|uniref:BTAD domain-containing putative transcriptional regulator n=1 Tax=Amycolatopsis sp. NPDC024027 TaxID=3154327 RepID=UPI0033ED3A2F
MATELRVLEQVELRVDGRLVEVGHARQRCVLAVLVVEANRIVTMEQLLERVWADRLPYKARQVASNYVSRLRQVLTPTGDIAVVRRRGGYMLEVDPEAVDLHRFRRLVQQARSADDARALALLEEATGLWRGEPFAGLDTPWLTVLRTGLEREHLAARLDRVDVALRCGRHTEVLPELFALAEQEDVDERVAAQFMLALHRAGRTSDALIHYRQLRARLIEQLGTEPGTALQDLHQRILDADPALAPSSAAMTGAATNAKQPVPRQLPAPPRWFTGRDTELARLDQALTAELAEGPQPASTGSETGAGTTVVISAIGGAGGIGKTWLALAWAHRHTEGFPDGQLFVDLHGFSPTQQPMAAAVAVRGFLDALGVDPDRIPTDLDAQAALYRSLVADRRMLIVLDNAATAEQVVPLLPGSPSCTVLVTCRTRLASLIDRHGARHLQLDVLTHDEARALLAARLGADRVAAEPGAVDELVALCGGYPLALSITARHAATRPDVPLTEIGAELRELGLEMLDHDTDGRSILRDSPGVSDPNGQPGLAPLLDGYQYDVFVSYRRSGPGNAARWVQQHFHRMLEDCLADQIGQTAVFLDTSAETGVHWPTMVQALARSKMLVAIWSPPYFASRWCLAELETMLARERAFGGLTQLVYPIVYSDGDTFPEWARKRQGRSVHKVSNPFPSFEGSHRQADLYDETCAIAIELAVQLARVPPWRPDWPACDVPLVPPRTPIAFPVYQP